MFAALPACSQAPVPEGLVLAVSLRDGAWCNSEDNGKTCSAYDDFREDGTIAACGQFSDDRRPFSAQGTYEVKGRFTCFVVTEASETFGLKPGYKFCTESLKIDAKEHTYRDVETGEITTQYRVPKTAMKCPTEAV